MQLSIVIVNYNVSHFLRQCLHSVYEAIGDIQAEVFVVDNHSSDDSVGMVQQFFPQVKLIANNHNPGFSRANNQAIRMCTGKYVLLLNPDTVVAEDTFSKCIAFMETTPLCGALGVHMIDGKGLFLPESKRGLPTPEVAFYKMFGIAALFPKSQRFGTYHLRFLPEKQTNPVDVLSGAFMLVRGEALEKAGLLDEEYFMYGEDIDWSYRIKKAGYLNYYFAATSIIHYKGESTKKGTLNYVIVFYKAMAIFARKHFASKQAGFMNLLINIAIVARGALTWLASLAASNFLWILDFALSFIMLYFLKGYWERNIKFVPDYYPSQFLFVVVPAYITAWMFFSYLAGAYERPFVWKRLLAGIAAGTLFIAATHGFLPETWRFSRALILLGAIGASLSMGSVRLLYNLIRYRNADPSGSDASVFLVLGSDEEFAEVSALLKRKDNKSSVVHLSSELKDDLLSMLLEKYSRIAAQVSLVFCSPSVSYQSLISRMENLKGKMNFKIFSHSAQVIIGSDSRDGSGEITNRYSALKSDNHFSRNKRMADLSIVFLLLLFAPLWRWKNKMLFGKLLSNFPAVVKGNLSWIGPLKSTDSFYPAAQKTGVMCPWMLDENENEELYLTYLTDFHFGRDIRLVFNNFWSGSI